MEEFEDMESEAFDPPDATATTRGHGYEAASQNGQIMRQLEAESKKNPVEKCWGA